MSCFWFCCNMQKLVLCHLGLCRGLEWAGGPSHSPVRKAQLADCRLCARSAGLLSRREEAALRGCQSRVQRAMGISDVLFVRVALAEPSLSLTESFWWSGLRTAAVMFTGDWKETLSEPGKSKRINKNISSHFGIHRGCPLRVLGDPAAGAQPVPPSAPRRGACCCC